MNQIWILIRIRHLKLRLFFSFPYAMGVRVTGIFREHVYLSHALGLLAELT